MNFRAVLALPKMARSAQTQYEFHLNCLEHSICISLPGDTRITSPLNIFMTRKMSSLEPVPTMICSGSMISPWDLCHFEIAFRNSGVPATGRYSWLSAKSYEQRCVPNVSKNEWPFSCDSLTLSSKTIANPDNSHCYFRLS